MGIHWNEIPELIKKLNEFSYEQIQSILKKLHIELFKYYSGMACELCNPRAFDATDI